jgi:hypothetical protein
MDVASIKGGIIGMGKGLSPFLLFKRIETIWARVISKTQSNSD